MARAYLYTVRIHPKRKPADFRALGDYANNGGLWLGDDIALALAAVAIPPLPSGTVIPEPEVHAQYEGDIPNVAPDSVGATFLLHEIGVRSVLNIASVGRVPRLPE